MDIITYSDVVRYKNTQPKKRKANFLNGKTSAGTSVGTAAYSITSLQPNDFSSSSLAAAINPQKLLFGSSYKTKNAKKRLGQKEENLMLCSLFLLLLCMCIFYIPLLRLNWGISSIKAITFLDEPSATNAMRDLAMPASDITKDETIIPQLEISEPLSPSDNSVFITSVDFKDYIVARGDTVSSITQKFGLKNMGTLLSVNNINNAKSLTVGQKLSIPSTDGIIYTVIKGDSLGEIAAKFKLPLTAILDANDMESQTISLGQRLFIPGASISTFELRKALGELFIYPIAGRLTSPFGYRRDPFTGRKSFHTGIDIAAPTGTPIKLTLDGTVSYTGYSTIYGNYVIVTHSGGYQSMYGHMHTIKVKRGQILSQGSIIGTVGNTGRSTGPHVHFSVYKNGKLINPLTVLK